MKPVTLPWLSLVGCLGASIGCGNQSSSPSPTSAHTYWGDVAPLLHDKCMACHQPGGIGPFSMLSYDEVAPRAPLIGVMTQSRKMPPYLITHDGSCGQFDDAEALTQAQIDLLAEWARGEMAVGTKVTVTAPSQRHLEGGTEYHTPALVPVAAGGDLAQFDEYRCFAIDTSLSRNQFVTGYEVLPGKPEIVHHVIAFLVDPAKQTKSGKTNAEIMASLDAADPDRVGWSCFGAAGDGVEEEGAPVVWAPGQGPMRFPEGMGVRQRPTDKLVIQIHYNLADGNNGLMDSTTVRVRYADTVDRRLAFLLPDGFLQSLFTKDPPEPDTLQPGLPSVRYTWKTTMKELGLDMAPPLEVIGVAPHMHQRGRKSELHLLGAGNEDMCAARVEDWNFHWQKMYFYRGTRPILTSGSQIQLTCDYDTSQDHAPVLPGWGTRNEMCLDSLMVALPAGM
jgi:Copper type II ascorbate-dependent monooxygenase, C-terminal domain